MRISDWSSDVCSSDLQRHAAVDVERAEPDLTTPEQQRGRREQEPANIGQPVMCEEIDVDRGGERIAGPHRRVARIAKVENAPRSEEHTSELQSLMRNSYAVFCMIKKETSKNT